MKMINTFGVDFISRLLKNDKTKASLYARITVNGETKEISLKTLIDSKDWDSDREEVVGKQIEAKAINDYIKKVRFRLMEHYRFLEDKQYLITAQDVKSAYLGLHTAQNQDYTLCKLMTYHFEQMGDKLKPGTLKNYYATQEYVKRFIKHKYKRDDVFLIQLDYTFITELENYIPRNPIKEHDKCTANGTAKHIERVKKMVGWAKKLRWIKIDPFEDFSPHRVKSFREKLSMEELIEIERKELVNERLNYVRDVFLFSCYTGLAYADLMSVRPEDFVTDDSGKIWCIFYRQKSVQKAAVPLLAAAVEIMNKYKTNPKSLEKGTIFPYLSNQEVNRNLKVIQEVCGIKKYVSFHLARHTFATTVMLKSGVPMETVSKMLGHTKISTTQIYAEVDEEKIQRDMVFIEEKLFERKNLLKAV